jgi:hypothetical protein
VKLDYFLSIHTYVCTDDIKISQIHVELNDDRNKLGLKLLELKLLHQNIQTAVASEQE